MKKIILLAILLSTTAFAQDAKPVDEAPAAQPSPPTSTSGPAPSVGQPTPKTFYIKLDTSDLNALSLALIELPKKLADPLILKINKQLQLQDQISAAAQAATDPKAKKQSKK